MYGLQHITTHCNRCERCVARPLSHALQCALVYCGVLQCVAVCCRALQRVAACCNALSCLPYVSACCSVLQCVALCVAVHGSVLQDLLAVFHTASPCPMTATRCNQLQHTAALAHDVLQTSYGLATISRLLKTKGFFCRISSLL